MNPCVAARGWELCRRAAQGRDLSAPKGLSAKEASSNESLRASREEMPSERRGTKPLARESEWKVREGTALRLSRAFTKAKQPRHCRDKKLHNGERRKKLLATTDNLREKGRPLRRSARRFSREG